MLGGTPHRVTDQRVTEFLDCLSEHSMPRLTRRHHTAGTNSHSAGVMTNSLNSPRPFFLMLLDATPDIVDFYLCLRNAISSPVLAPSELPRSHGAEIRGRDTKRRQEGQFSRRQAIWPKRWKTRFIPFRVGQPFRIGRIVSLWVLSPSAFDRSTTYVQEPYSPLPAALQDSRMLRATSRRSIGDATETSIAGSSGLRILSPFSGLASAL
jgi:hypothetical protein